jgi:hypothetical protein
MVTVRSHVAQGLPLLFGGIAAGVLLSLFTRVGSGANPATVVLLAGLPFCLAAMTGVAKTTTA